MSAGRTRLQRQPAGTREFPRPVPVGAGGTLLQAVKDGDYEDLKLRISKGEDITQQDDLGLTPLHYAARAGKGLCLELLLNNGADPNRRCHLGRTPLHYAARYGFSKVVDSLCRLGKSQTINVDARDKSKWTPLHLAAEKGHPKVAHTLLKHGAKVDAVIESTTWTPLHLAAENSHNEVIQVLLANGARKDKLVEHRWGIGEIAGRFQNKGKREATKAILENREVQRIPLTHEDALDLAAGPNMFQRKGGENAAIAHEGKGPNGAHAGANNGNRE